MLYRDKKDQEHELKGFSNYCRYSLVVWGIAGLALYSCSAKSAEIRPAVGMNCGVSAGDGAWKQDGQNYTYKSCQTSVSLQFIQELPLHWGPVRFDYRIGGAYRKGAKVSDGEWVSDKCYERHQNTGGGIVNYYGKPEAECDLRWFSRKVEQRTKAATLAFGSNIDVAPALTVYAAMGISFYKTITKVEWDHTRGVCVVSECATASYSRSGQSDYFELGAKYQAYSFTAVYAPNERAREGISKGNYSFMFGYGFDLKSLY